MNKRHVSKIVVSSGVDTSLAANNKRFSDFARNDRSGNSVIRIDINTAR